MIKKLYHKLMCSLQFHEIEIDLNDDERLDESYVNRVYTFTCKNCEYEGGYKRIVMCHNFGKVYGGQHD